MISAGSQELRTPPLPVVAFISCSDVHKDVSEYFKANPRPPLVVVSLPDANESVLARLFGGPRPAKAFRTPDGILKADWVSKQRTRRAAVAVAFVNRSDVEGDPTAWLRMTRGLTAIKAASVPRGVWLVLVVVQDGPIMDLPQDRITGLWNSFEPKQLVMISRQMFDPGTPTEQRQQMQEEQLRPLQQLINEAAAAYYTAASTRLRQRQLDLVASLGSCPPEISAAIAFKLAVLAEFRQDWPGAVASYQAAAAALQGVPLGRPTVSCQRHAEVMAVAEVVHFKALMLLLHQQRYAEALAQLAMHLAAFGRPPDGLPLAAAAAHYGWLARQYQTAAELVSGSRMDAGTLQAHPEAEPCHLLMSAAQLALTRKTLMDQLMQMGGGPPAFDVSSVKRGRYLGQFEFKQPQGPTGSSDLTDAEFGWFLDAEERRVNHSQVVLDLLLQAQAAHLLQAHPQPAAPGLPAPSRAAGSRGAADRVSARLAFLIAEQQVETHNLTAARKLLLHVVYTYRRDGWDSLLLHSLMLLRDVCQRLKLHKEALLLSLEVACVADSLHTGSAAACDAQSAPASGLFDHEQAKGLASAALLGLLAGPQDMKSSLKKPVQQPEALPVEQQHQQHAQEVQQQQQGSGQPVARSSPHSSWEYEVQQVDLAAALQQMPAGREDAAAQPNHVAEILLMHKQQDFGWWRLVSVSGGFVAHSTDPTQLCVCIALRNNLPVPLPLDSASLTLADAQGSWQRTLLSGPGGLSSPDSAVQAQELNQALPGSPAAAATAAASLGSLRITDTHTQQAAQQQPSLSLQLQPGRWQQLHVVFAPHCIGTVVVEALRLQLSGQASVVFQVQSFPPGRLLLGSAAVGGAQPFSLQQQVKQGSWSAKVGHVGALPQLQVLVPDLLLVGEFVPVCIRVSVTAHQSAATLELSVRSSSSIPPSSITLLAALPDGKLQELSLDQQLLPLPALPAGAEWKQRLWVRSRTALQCRLTAALSCPALVVAAAELSFLQPLEHRVRLCVEPGVHSLVGPAPAIAVLNSSTADGSSSSSSDAVAGRAGPADAAAGAVPLVVGQSMMAQVLIATRHAADLLLLGAQLELEPGSQLKLLNSLSQQLAAAPLAARPGSVHCLLLHLVATAKCPAATSMGRLKLSWRRAQPAAAPDAHDQATGRGSSGGGNGAVSAAAAAAAAAIDSGPAPSVDVETSLELPSVVVQDSLLSVKVTGPQNVTAGTSFPFTLQVHNLTTQPQEVQVLVQETHGFVFAGSKQQVVNVVPRTTHNITWTLVAHASGQLQLPSVRVSCTKLSCVVVTQGGTIHVVPY